MQDCENAGGSCDINLPGSRHEHHANHGSRTEDEQMDSGPDWVPNHRHTRRVHEPGLCRAKPLLREQMQPEMNAVRFIGCVASLSSDWKVSCKLLSISNIQNPAAVNS
jgi:hypothetical protein